MNDMEQFDEILRNRLNQYESPVPDRLWNNIDQARAARKPAPVWSNTWLLSAFGLLLLLPFAYLLLRQPHPDTRLSVRPTDALTEIPRPTEKLPATQGGTSLTSDQKHFQIPAKSESPMSFGKSNGRNADTRTFDQLTEMKTELPAPIASATEASQVANPAQEATVFPARNPMTFSGLPSRWPELSLTAERWKLPKFQIKETDCPSFGKRNGPSWYVDVYGSPDYAFRTLSANADNAGYAAIRDSTEKSLYAFSAGARVSMIWQSGFAFRAGVHYAQINERFDYLNPKETQTTTVNVIVDTLINGPDTTFVWDTLSITQTGTRIKKTYNYYRFVDIPLIVGYEMHFNDWTINLNGGVLINLVASQKGDFLDPIDRPVTFTTGAANGYKAFKGNAGLSVYASVGFLYQLNDRLQLMLEPHFRHYLASLSESSYLLQQRYNSTGILIGLRYKLK